MTLPFLPPPVLSFVNFFFENMIRNALDSNRGLGVHCRTELWRLSYIPEIVAN